MPFTEAWLNTQSNWQIFGINARLTRIVGHGLPFKFAAKVTRLSFHLNLWHMSTNFRYFYFDICNIVKNLFYG